MTAAGANLPAIAPALRYMFRWPRSSACVSDTDAYVRQNIRATARARLASIRESRPDCPPSIVGPTQLLKLNAIMTQGVVFYGR